MLLRLLFCLTGSLLSGSAVAGLFTALVLHFFPDPTNHQKPSGVKLEAYQGARWAEVPIPPESLTVPTSPTVRPAALAAGAPEPATSSAADIRQFEAALKVAPDPSAQQDPVAFLRLKRQLSGQQQHLGPTVATQDGSRDTEQVFSISVATGILSDRIRAPAPSNAAADPPTQQDEFAGAAQPSAEVSAQERKPEPGPISQQNSQDRKPTITTSLVARDGRARAAAGSRATRAGQVDGGAHADHAHRRRIDHPGGHHRPIRQAQR